MTNIHDTTKHGITIVVDAQLRTTVYANDESESIARLAIAQAAQMALGTSIGSGSGVVAISDKNGAELLSAIQAELTVEAGTMIRRAGKEFASATFDDSFGCDGAAASARNRGRLLLAAAVKMLENADAAGHARAALAAATS